MLELKKDELADIYGGALASFASTYALLIKLSKLVGMFIKSFIN